jgi:AcrR family transcriptional regulator
MATDTKRRILDTAEQLFAENGYSATSLRTIIGTAGVNLAAVHYHFRSKQELLKAVMARRIGPINRERIEELEAAERAAGPEGPELEQVLEAFLMPVFRASRDPNLGGNVFLRLFGMLYGESGDEVREFFVEQMGPVALRFIPAFSRTLPHLTRKELYWRIYFCVGVMAHILRGGVELRLMSKGLCDPSRWEQLAPRVIEFLAGGLRAPARADSEGLAPEIGESSYRVPASQNPNSRD